MNGITVPASALPRSLEAALAGGLAFSLFGVLALVAWAPEAVSLIPIGLAAFAFVVLLVRHARINIRIILVGYAVVFLGRQVGLDIIVVLFGVYLVTFLVLWYAHNIRYNFYSFFVTWTDRVLAAFLLLLPAYVALAMLTGAPADRIVAETRAISMLAFYFPIKSFVKNNQRGSIFVVYALIWLGFSVAVNNLFNFQQVLLQATQAWQVADVRLALNEGYLVTGFLASLVLIIHSKSRLVWLLMGLTLILLLLVLVFTKSRAYWGAAVIGSVVLFFMFDSRAKLNMMVMMGIGGMLVVGLSVLVLGDTAILIFDGIVRRFSSLDGAASRDISLINRFVETEAAMRVALTSPIVGHGPGAMFGYHSLIFEYYIRRPDVHNGFAWVFFKFGIIGLFMLFGYFFLSIIDGVRAFKLKSLLIADRIGGAVAAASLAGLGLTIYTSNPFVLSDLMFMTGVLSGMASGILVRHRGVTPIFS